MLCIDLGKGFFQLVIVLRSEKRERCDQRPGTDAGDEFEPGPMTGLARPYQEAGTECAVRSAAGQRQCILMPLTIFTGEITR